MTLPLLSMAPHFVPDTARGQAVPQKWALLIGIDEYRDRARINTLGGAAADARALKAALIDAAGFPEKNIRLLVSDADPSVEGEARPIGNTILNELGDLSTRVKPGDTVFVSYAGHGIQTGDTAYLLPYDTDASDDETLLESIIPVTKFRDRLMKVRAGTLILVFDMCRTDPWAGIKSLVQDNTLKKTQVSALLGPATEKPDVKTTDVPDVPQVFMLFACEEGQRSYEWPDKGRGYFSYYLEEGLRGKAADEKGTVFLDRLAGYVAEQVSNSVKRREAASQIPFHRITGPPRRFAMATNVVYSERLTKPPASTPVDTIAQFRLNVDPKDARVEIDGVEYAERPVQVDLGVATKPQVVVLRVSAPGYETHQEALTLQRGLNKPVTVLLKGGPPEEPPSRTGAEPGRAPLTFDVKAEGDADVAASTQRNSLRVVIRRIGRTPMQVYAYSEPSFLREGRQYTLRFRARADKPRQMQVLCQMAAADRHNIGLNTNLPLTTEWQEFRLTFTASRLNFRGKKYPLHAPLFVLGNQKGTVWIEDCTLEEQ